MLLETALLWELLAIKVLNNYILLDASCLVFDDAVDDNYGLHMDDSHYGTENQDSIVIPDI